MMFSGLVSCMQMTAAVPCELCTHVRTWHVSVKFSANLQTISASTRKHLVDAEHVEGVRPHAQVEGILARILDHVLVGSNTCRLQCFAAHLLLLPAAAQTALVSKQSDEVLTTAQRHTPRVCA